MLILNVPFNEKDEVKKLGARWNPDIKKWYIHKREDYYKFANILQKKRKKENQ